MTDAAGKGLFPGAAIGSRQASPAHDKREKEEKNAYTRLSALFFNQDKRPKHEPKETRPENGPRAWRMMNLARTYGENSILCHRTT